MHDRTNRTFICSVVFLDIADYSRKPVTEQIRLKDRFNALIADAIRDIPVNDRIVLDTGDGAAISFLGDPEDALFVAISIRDAATAASGAPPIPIRIGINLGPIRLIKDINGQPNIIGDGINVAQRVMGFAEPGQILASRSYHEVVSCLSDEYATLFSYQGYRTDKHVRAHDIYSVGQPGRDLRDSRVPARGKTASASDTVPLSPGRNQSSSRQKSRQIWIALAVAVAAILSTGGFVRYLKHRPAEPEKQLATVKLVPPQPRPRIETSPAPAASRPLTEPEVTPKSAASPVARANEATAGTTPDAQLLLQVLPWGEVYVDGKLMGVSPPLRSVDVKAGRHVVELRNTSFPPYTELVVAKPAEKIRIRHRFRQE
jgi:hypothetical protein